MRAVAGIDTHKDTLAIAVVDDAGREQADAMFDNNTAGHHALESWLAAQPPVTRIGIEGSGGLGRAVALALQHAGWDVCEVPPQLTARDRRHDTKAGKTDQRDAVLIARITLREETLPAIKPEGLGEDLAALLAHRDHLVSERTRTANRTHALLSVVAPGYAARCRQLRTQAHLRSAGDVVEDLEGVRVGLVRRNLERLHDLDIEIRVITREVDELVTASGTSLTTVHGVGPLVAARILSLVGDPARYPTKHKFARANGTAPIPASSGRTQRHRLNRGGNRQLNRAIYTVALTQIRHYPPAQAYYARKLTEHKTKRDAMRCLKRRVSDAIYRQLRADARALDA